MLTGEEGQMPWLAKALCRAGFHESDVEKYFHKMLFAYLRSGLVNFCAKLLTMIHYSFHINDFLHKEKANKYTVCTKIWFFLQ